MGKTREIKGSEFLSLMTKESKEEFLASSGGFPCAIHYERDHQADGGYSSYFTESGPLVVWSDETAREVEKYDTSGLANDFGFLGFDCTESEFLAMVEKDLECKMT